MELSDSPGTKKYPQKAIKAVLSCCCSFCFFFFFFGLFLIILTSSFVSCCDCLAHICRRKKELKARTVWLGCPEKCEEKYPKNAIKNQKYNIITFVPGVSGSSSHTTCSLLQMNCLALVTEFAFRALIFALNAAVFPFIESMLPVFIVSTVQIHPFS